MVDRSAPVESNTSTGSDSRFSKLLAGDICGALGGGALCDARVQEIGRIAPGDGQI